MRQVEHAQATYDTPHLEAAVAVFALLANPVRVKMILAIRDIEVSANHLADIVDLPVDQTVHELDCLQSAGIVSRRRRESGDFYLLTGAHAAALAEGAIFHAEHQQQEHAHAGPLAPNSRPNDEGGTSCPVFLD
ncbi:winged helix-turn-helix domain-containing protein [Pseudoclavibacter helvolus]|uniref:winged helix-turn-helix domain-containing protein n=1 Tax=Pseudoclavibacter helvolus TaxID=255205 RepID=UPI0024AD8482|nr:winged helix-turn-helix domain-containing protein [Pseudoclavibacter helvolus]